MKKNGSLTFCVVTLLFEAYQMLLIDGEIPISKVSETIKETSPRIWRVFGYWIERALRKEDLSSVTKVGVDETSRKKGHQYVTQFVDMDAHRTIYVTQGNVFYKLRADKQACLPRRENQLAGGHEHHFIKKIFSE